MNKHQQLLYVQCTDQLIPEVEQIAGDPIEPEQRKVGIKQCQANKPDQNDSEDKSNHRLVSMRLASNTKEEMQQGHNKDMTIHSTPELICSHNVMCLCYVHHIEIQSIEVMTLANVFQVLICALHLVTLIMSISITTYKILLFITVCVQQAVHYLHYSCRCHWCKTKYVDRTPPDGQLGFWVCDGS